MTEYNKVHSKGSIRGWICPYCNTIYSPMVSYCDCQYKPKEEPKTTGRESGFNPIKPLSERT